MTTLRNRLLILINSPTSSSPIPPAGFVFLLDESGNYIQNDDGTLKIVERL